MGKLILAILLMGIPALAQNTVSATITDLDGNAWANGTYVISFQPSPSVPQMAGQTVYSGALNSSGAFSVSLPTASWNFRIAPNASQGGFSSTQVITTTVSLTATLSALARGPRFQAGPNTSGPYGYADGEVLIPVTTGLGYFNVASNKQRIWNGTAWQDGGGGGSSVSGTGTPTHLPIWTATTVLGDSPAIYSGSLFTFPATVYVPQTITSPAGAIAFSSAQALTPIGAWTGTPDTTAPIQSILTADFDSATGTIDSGAFASDMEVNGDTQAIDQVYGGLSELSLNGNAAVSVGYGFSAYAGNYGAAAVAALTGLDTETENDAGGGGTVNQRAIHGVVYQKSGGTSSEVWGDSQVVVLQGSGSHMGIVNLIYPRTPEIDPGATIDTITGVYIDTMKVTGVTTAYAINQRGATDLNYFHGLVQMDNLTGHGTKGPVCADASGNLYIGNNSGVGAPCP